MPAYYNEIDPYCAAWLRNLISADLIAPGDVDERSIVDVTPDDLAGYTQAHFFAGIGVWSYALRLAGWPDGRTVWTGSCPCQPFSPAGKGDGPADPRHLWPAWFRLIRERRPHTLFGEQVSGLDGLAWLDLVHADVEACDYAIGTVTLPAASVGAPHQRHRIFWVADTGRDGGRSQSRRAGVANGRAPIESDRHGDALVVADAAEPRPARREDGRADCGDAGEGSGRVEPERSGAAGLVGDATSAGHERRSDVTGSVVPPRQRQATERHASVPGATNGFWSDAEWLYCRDGKYRPTLPAALLLAHGYPADVGVLCAGKTFPNRGGLLRGFGNAIVPQVAAAFVRAYMETRGWAPQEREGETR